ncbi:MAG: hypothetical protein JO033_12640 [Acidobacteriaceae bacterium]|nr:hypothetical protein [Acidobacteriaceae bacterium]MBV9499696.1 hypothetical protein [Acidobacteriaceae bacterium]
MRKYAYGLEEIVSALNERKQRATYGAVAGVLGLAPHTVTGSRPRIPRYSWVVALNGTPTGYNKEQIDPDCLEQIRSSNQSVIKDSAKLMEWLETGFALAQNTQ